MKTSFTLFFSLLLSCFLVLTATAQTTVKIVTPPCRSKVQVFGMHGLGYYVVAELSAKPEKKSSADGQESEQYVYTWTYDGQQPKIFYIGTSMRDFFPVLVGPESQFEAIGQCGNFNSSTITGSAANVAYQQLLQQLNANNQAYTELAKAYGEAEKSGDAATLAQQRAALADLDAKKVALVEKTKRENPYLGRIAAANTYLSYVNADRTKYPTGLEHYLGTIWQFVDFKDQGYNDMNVVYEASVNHLNTLLSAISDPAQLKTVVEDYIQRWPVASSARMYALGGAFAVLSQRSHPLALNLGQRILDDYQPSHPEAVAGILPLFNQLRTSVPGSEVPDLVGTSPSGETLRLSDLRGKVVLIDFWASWCGPCRKENPNVVRMYKKYADKGFEIFGVSLDRDKARWEQAIADDQLTWPHISDLKQWKSEHAALYGVRSIPDALLIDAEGKIIARKLRGAQLEQALENIFGEGK